MKKVFISVALISVLATMTISCKKEEMYNLYPNAEDVNAVRIIRYTINGNEYNVTIYGENQWREFVNRMMALAYEGNEVHFTNESALNSSIASKDVHVYKTKDEDDANRWVREMADQGYTVNITYEDGVFICTAVKP